MKLIVKETDMEDKTIFTDSHPNTISEGLQSFIDSMMEEIVLEGKSFDTQRKYLRKFSEKEGLDYDKLEADISTFIEILASLKTTSNQLLVKFAKVKAKDCYISEETMEKLVNFVLQASVPTENPTRGEKKNKILMIVSICLTVLFSTIPLFFNRSSTTKVYTFFMVLWVVVFALMSFPLVMKIKKPSKRKLWQMGAFVAMGLYLVKVIIEMTPFWEFWHLHYAGFDFYYCNLSNDGYPYYEYPYWCFSVSFLVLYSMMTLPAIVMTISETKPRWSWFWVALGTVGVITIALYIAHEYTFVVDLIVFLIGVLAYFLTPMTKTEGGKHIVYSMLSGISLASFVFVIIIDIYTSLGLW